MKEIDWKLEIVPPSPLPEGIGYGNSATVEELYQAFKKRLMEEALVDRITTVQGRLKL